MPRAELSHASTGVPKRNVSQAQADPADADAIGDLADHDRAESPAASGNENAPVLTAATAKR